MTNSASMKRYYIFFACLAVVCALAIVSNTLLRREPVHDATAATDIRNLQGAVDNYYLSQTKLPTSLREVTLDGLAVATRLGNYTYNRLDADSYELCATFATSHQTRKNYYEPGPDGAVADPDNHTKGLQCFSYTVLPIQPVFPRR